MNTKKIVELFFDSLANGDLDTLFSLFAHDVKWHQPGNHKFSGIKNGTDEVGSMIGEMMQDSAGSFVIKRSGQLMENGNLVAAPIRFSAVKGTQSMDMAGIDLFKVEEDKITEVWLFSEDQQKEDDFWGK